MLKYRELIDQEDGETIEVWKSPFCNPMNSGGGVYAADGPYLLLNFAELYFLLNDC